MLAACQGNFSGTIYIIYGKTTIPPLLLSYRILVAINPPHSLDGIRLLFIITIRFVYHRSSGAYL
jgi:hypothetical protein